MVTDMGAGEQAKYIRGIEWIEGIESTEERRGNLFRNMPQGDDDNDSAQ